MREIKFRAWDKDKKQMIYKFNMTSDGQPYTWDKATIGDGIVIDEPAPLNVELMQYTGLRDKNGREVYEGDIVRFKDWWDEEMVGEVRYSEKDMAFTIVNDFWDGFPIMYADDLEVIGNIYKNPELLEAAEE